MRRYELMLLFRPDLEDDKLQSAVEKVTRAIVNAGGALTKVSPWGKRRLAYEIQHFRDASYFLLHFDIAPAQIREIERGLLISEEILRHMVVVLEDRGEMSEEDLPPAARRDDDEDESDEDRSDDDASDDDLPADDERQDQADADDARDDGADADRDATDEDGDRDASDVDVEDDDDDDDDEKAQA